RASSRYDASAGTDVTCRRRGSVLRLEYLRGVRLQRATRRRPAVVGAPDDAEMSVGLHTGIWRHDVDGAVLAADHDLDRQRAAALALQLGRRHRSVDPEWITVFEGQAADRPAARRHREALRDTVELEVERGAAGARVADQRVAAAARLLHL